MKECDREIIYYTWNIIVIYVWMQSAEADKWRPLNRALLALLVPSGRCQIGMIWKRRQNGSNRSGKPHSIAWVHEEFTMELSNWQHFVCCPSRSKHTTHTRRTANWIWDLSIKWNRYRSLGVLIIVKTQAMNHSQIVIQFNSTFFPSIISIKIPGSKRNIKSVFN